MAQKQTQKTISQLESILLAIFDITGDADDKDEFIDRFIEVCLSEATLKVVNALPVDKQTQLELKLKNKLPAQQVNIINSEIRIETREKAILDTARKLLHEYISTLVPHIDDAQQQALVDLVQNSIFT